MAANRRLVHVAPLAVSGNLRGRRLVAVHIPRTAGTTLDWILEVIALRTGVAEFRAEGTVYGQFLGEGKGEAAEHLRRTDPGHLATVQMFTGHVPVSDWDRAIDARRAAYVTMLRDPVDRMMSQYLLGVGRNGWGPGTAIGNLVRSGQLLDNLQVRMLAGCNDAQQPCDDAMLKAAMANLQERFALIGTSDGFDTFLGSLLGLYGWPEIIYARYHVGTAKVGDSRDAALRAEAAAFNTFDAELLANVRKHGNVWVNRVDAAEAPERSEDVLLPLTEEGKFVCVSRSELGDLERLAREVNCRLTHA